MARMEVAFLTPALVCFQIVNLEAYKATAGATLKNFWMSQFLLEPEQRHFCLFRSEYFMYDFT